MALVPFPGQAAPDLSDDAELVRPDLTDVAAPPPQDTPAEEEDPLEGRMTFLEHLDELRKRITHAVLALLVGFLIAFAFVERIFAFVFERLVADVPGKELVYTEPGEAFLLYIKIAVLCGVLIASPYIMWQVWLFIAPGLYANEKKLAIPFVVMSSALFIGGAAFSHYIVFPVAWRFFAGFSTGYLAFMPRVEPVFSMYVKLILALGLVFQLPVMMFVLGKLGLVTAGFLVRNIKYATLIIFIVAALITADASPVNQALVAAPMMALYLISIGIVWLFGKGETADKDDDRS